MRKRPRRIRTRVNERIRVSEIRVIYGEANLVLPTHKALTKAKSLGLDLVEIAPHARPPVCRIVDYGKWKYEQAKLKKSEKPKKRDKEVKFGVNIDPHDYMIKLTRAEDFLAHGFKLRMVLWFKGRQMAHKDLGFELMQRVKEDLSGMANIDLEPKLNNRNILMMLSPFPKEKQVRKFRVDEEEEIDLDAHDEAEAAEAVEHGHHDDDEDDIENDADSSEADSSEAETGEKEEKEEKEETE